MSVASVESSAPTADSGDSAAVVAAAGEGYPILRSPDHRIEADAARLTADCDRLVGLGIAGGVLLAVTDRIPSPAEVDQWERRVGMAVTVSVAETAVFDALQARAELLAGGETASVAAALTAASEAGATDVLLAVGDQPRQVVNGVTTPQGRRARLSAVEVAAATTWLLGTASSATVPVGADRWRVRRFSSGGNDSLALRRLPAAPPRLEELSLPPAVADVPAAGGGLVLVVSPTGGGKTTTAAALLDRVITSRPVRVLTVEDPVEFIHRPRKAVVAQQQVGRDVTSLAAGAAAAGGLGVDVVYLSALPDATTTRAALTAADSGQLVIACVPGTSAAATLRRLAAQFSSEDRGVIRELLASCLRAVIAQQLLPTVDGDRIAVCEVLLWSPAVATMIREDRTHELSAHIDASGSDGMESFDRSLARYVAAERIDLAVAQATAHNRDMFDAALRSAPSRRDAT
jgi:twitching motility protein PilT